MKTKSLLAVLLLMVAGVVTAWAQSGQITSVTVTVRYNHGPAVQLQLPAEGFPEIDLTAEPVKSIILQKITATTTGDVSELSYAGTRFLQSEDSSADPEFHYFPFPTEDYSYWELDFTSGLEIILPDAELAPTVFQFFCQGKAADGTDIYYNNGGQNYSLVYVPAENRFFTTNVIKNLTLTVSYNGAEPVIKSYPESGASGEVVTGETSSMRILRAEIETSADLNRAVFTGTVYDPANEDDSYWVDLYLLDEGNGIWAIDFPDGLEFIQEEWRTEDKTRNFEFFVFAEDTSDNYYAYDNDGGNYITKLTTGTEADPNWKVKFPEKSVATIALLADDEPAGYIFDGDGSRLPDTDLGEIHSLAINDFLFQFMSREVEAYTYNAWLKYKVYEEGGDGQWSAIEATDNVIEERIYYRDLSEYNLVTAIATDLAKTVTDGLEYGKDYVLEVMYQILLGSDYYSFGEGNENFRIKFTLVEGRGINSLTSDASAKTNAFYNLAGQRVGKDYKGIVVTGGRKELRK
jgi:hypothetical protein